MPVLRRLETRVVEHHRRITAGIRFVSRLRAGLIAAALIPAAALAAPSFVAQQTFATGTGPRAIAAADFNADGRADLVVANQGDDNVSVFLNTVDSASATVTFATQQTFTAGNNPVSVAVGDIDGDGKPDIVVANASGGTISVLRNTTAAGATTTTFAAQQTFPAGIYPYSVAIGDLDGDGKPDVVVANVGDATVSVLRNATAAGSATVAFDTQQKYSVGREPAGVAIADFNGDGLPDVAVANILAYSISVYLNTSTAGSATASVAAAKSFLTGLGPASIIAADVDGDGRPDLVTANQADAAVNVLANTMALGATTAAFAAKQAVTVGTGPNAVVAADVSGDGKFDLVAANNQVKTVSALVNSTTYGGVNADQHGLTASWFNPATSGQGVEIEIYPNLNGGTTGVLFGGWFTYGATAGSGQSWYALSGGVSNGSPLAVLGIYAGEGGNFAAAPSVAPTRVGTAVLNFTSCEHAVLDYQFFDGRKGSVPLNRLTANVTCGAAGDTGAAASNYLLSGSWSQADIGGQGLIFDVNPLQNNFFAAWYTYAPNAAAAGAASQRWYTIQAAFAPGSKTLTSVPIYATSGGVFDNATAPTAAPVGTATITFSSCTEATLSYAFTAGANAGLSGTLALTRTGPTPAGCTL
jgi:hypothetical protein